MTIGLKANVSGTSGTIQIGGADQITVDNAGGLTATTVTGTTVAGTTVTQGGVAMPRMVLSTAQNTTSGTAIDFTGIPSWVKRITVTFSGVSTTGTSNHLIQIGSGSVQTTGYVSTCGTFAAGPATGITSTAIGFNINSSTAAETVSGIMTICLLGSNTWVASHSVKTGTSAVGNGGGNVTLAGTLDRVRLTTLNGTDTFDAGSVNILYEG